MAKYDRLSESLRIAKEFNKIGLNRAASEENTLKSMNKARENNKLYSEGKLLAMTGGDINSANELVYEKEKMIPKKDHRNFKAGYLNGKKELENQMAKKTGLSR